MRVFEVILDGIKVRGFDYSFIYSCVVEGVEVRYCKISEGVFFDIAELQVSGGVVRFLGFAQSPDLVFECDLDSGDIQGFIKDCRGYFLARSHGGNRSSGS